ncbi:hypothetical protein BUALT_Bualt04G0095100 [Buddleja alternifolia]|uniref:Knr4/Smi1-like domain-containing protein n=1 Tax=Buddleja alternifolia TaxID=168488 RepID=A0AAV6XYG2_9LAMI|nr:hypothetical protein BUALT_Bualt04G0095100 [Buddleja alternifolia]
MATTILNSFPHTAAAAMEFSHIPKPLRVCFSYAAYAKNLIHHLQYSNIPVEAGLTEAEFSAVESSFNFTFPPDLRSILQEGLPVGPGFPNWRFSSKQQLHILTHLPILGICKEVSRNCQFWIESWGDRPDDFDRAVKVAEKFLQNAPILVPIYRHFYIPSTPSVSGNPVFYVRGGDVRLWSFDIAGFFQKGEFCSARLSNLFAAPAWAATLARKIELWTEMADRGVSAAARVETGGWWSGDLGGCLEEVFWRLREGGWKMEDVKEMMMIDGCDEMNHEDDISGGPLDRECVEWRVRALSDRLLGAGWSTEDVVESLGYSGDFLENGVTDGDSCFDFNHTKSCDDQKPNKNNPFTFQFIRV